MGVKLGSEIQSGDLVRTNGEWYKVVEPQVVKGPDGKKYYRLLAYPVKATKARARLLAIYPDHDYEYMKGGGA